jgi:RNA polymerase sigma-70 factor (ECF subfamily)
MPGTPDDFTDLLARARAGDQSALARLAQQYEPKVRIVARVLLGPALRPYLDSVDLVQSVHRSLLVGLRDEGYDCTGPEKMIALAVAMLRRKAARYWRHLRRQERPAPGAHGGLPELLVSLCSPQPDPARQAELRDAVECLCSDLSDEERRVLVLRSHDYTCAEVADELGLMPAAVRVRLSRLRKRLQERGVAADWL